MALSKASALRLASNALDSGATALRGPLVRNERGEFVVGDRNVSEWLKVYADQEVILIVAPIDSNPYVQVRTCGVCGRDYEGPECPHCAEVRARLRRR